MDFPLVLECSAAGIRLIEALEAQYDRRAWQRLLLDFYLYNGKAALMLGRTYLASAQSVFNKLKSRFQNHTRSLVGVLLVSSSCLTLILYSILGLSLVEFFNGQIDAAEV